MKPKANTGSDMPSLPACHLGPLSVHQPRIGVSMTGRWWSTFLKANLAVAEYSKFRCQELFIFKVVLFSHFFCLIFFGISVNVIFIARQ